MKSFESDIKKIAGKVRLKAMEREAIRERILSYMEYHPLKKEPIDMAVLSPIQSEDFVYISFQSFWVRATSGVLALILIVGIPLLAERSVPGDILYLVKTGVNEGIQTQFATSPYEKVELETRLIERRIAEARLLASEGKLTTEVEAQIAETVKGHASAVQNELAELRVHDADGAAIAEIVFSSSLEVQSAVLETGQGSTSQSTALLDMVNTVRDEVASDENPTAPSYDGLLARIELETTRSYELFESVKENATTEEIADIERRLTDIDRSILAAKELKETDETGAVASLTSVLGLIQKLITFMTDIDVRETVALETLVPVVLTPEERTAIITVRLTDINAKIGEVDMQIASITDNGLKEKLLLVRADIDTRIASTTEALNIGDFDTAGIKSEEAVRAFTDLVTRLTVPQEFPEPGVVPEVLPVEEPDATTTDDGTTEEVATTTDSVPADSDGVILE